MSSRKEKYPETNVFHYHNQNPHNRITGDCMYRAISLAAEIPFETVIMDGAKIFCETGYEPTTTKCIDMLLTRYGWIKHKQPRKIDNTKFTGKEFCEQLANIKEKYIANIGSHHIVAIINNKVNDIWDSTGDCIGNYWTKGV